MFSMSCGESWNNVFLRYCPVCRSVSGKAGANACAIPSLLIIHPPVSPTPLFLYKTITFLCNK